MGGPPFHSVTMVQTADTHAHQSRARVGGVGRGGVGWCSCRLDASAPQVTPSLSGCYLLQTDYGHRCVRTPPSIDRLPPSDALGAHPAGGCASTSPR